jgi:hypothetical protein
MKALKNNLFNRVTGRLLPCFFLLLTAALLSPRPAGAAVPQSINYQGFLISKITSLPVETPQDINFFIYPSATGGSPIFTESRCNVGVNKGRYDVEIGSASGGIPDTVFIDNQNLWLEIQVDPDGNCTGTYEAMTPRIRLQASPFAFNSLFASTASAATPVFAADTIAALPVTANGAITISTNLFVQGGISVGSISPGQKLAVSGLVESRGDPGCDTNPANYTCGFRFPDGTTQVTAAANTMWGATGDYLYNMNPGNLGIGEFSKPPQARLHISSAVGETGNLLMVSTGTSVILRVNGYGQIYGGSYYGLGSTLAGIVVSSGSTMTGPLTLAASSITVTSALGVNTPKLKFLDKVEISSTNAANFGGIYISTHVRLAPGGIIYGDGSGLSGVVTTDVSKVFKTGDTMSGQLTLADSTLTVTGNAFSVGGTTLTVVNGNTAFGTASHLARLTVGGGLVATSSITAQNGLYTTTINGTLGANFQSVTASTGSFWGWAGPTDAASYSINTASGIKVNLGAVVAPYFIGDGSKLTAVPGTDITKLIKSGDTMTGHLLVSPSSVTILSMGAHTYALAVASAPSVETYLLAVTTAGNVGIGVTVAGAPLEVNKEVLISNTAGGDAQAFLYSNGGYSYLRWADNALTGLGNASQAAMGFLPGLNRSFVYRALGSTPGTGGSGNGSNDGSNEVFRINLGVDDITNGNSWRFGIGTSNPQEKFHIGTNLLVSTSTLSPLLYVSTTTGLVGVGSNAPDHKLHVNGGIMAVSSITAQGGFFGNGAGLTNISAGGLPGKIEVSSISARLDSTYSAVVFTSNTYVNAKLAVGEVFTPDSELHVRGTLHMDQHSGQSSMLQFSPFEGADAFISWYGDGTAKGALGFRTLSSDPVTDLIYRAGTTSMTGGNEAFRIKLSGAFLLGETGTSNITPRAHFNVVSDMMVSTGTAMPILLISTASGSVGISTGAANERMHVASSFLVGPSRAAAELYVSTGASAVGIGTGNPRARLEVAGAILAEGNTGGIPMTGAGTRFMWIPSLAALRAGDVNGAQWDTIGTYSTALGQSNTVGGSYSSILAGYANFIYGTKSVITAGDQNHIYGQSSIVTNGQNNVVLSSFSFAGGMNNYLDIPAQGTFVWGYDDIGGHSSGLNKLSQYRIPTPYAFLIDPDNVKGYKVGVRTASPQAALDINGDAQFGAGVTKSTITAEGFWVPRSMTNVEMQGSHPAAGAMAFNSDRTDICFFNGTVWVVVGTKTACE